MRNSKQQLIKGCKSRPLVNADPFQLTHRDSDIRCQVSGARIKGELNGFLTPDTRNLLVNVITHITLMGIIKAWS